MSFPSRSEEQSKPFVIPRLAVSFLGGTQPETIAPYLRRPDDGLLVRILWFWPDSQPFRLSRIAPDTAWATVALDRRRLFDLTPEPDGLFSQASGQEFRWFDTLLTGSLQTPCYGHANAAGRRRPHEATFRSAALHAVGGGRIVASGTTLRQSASMAIDRKRRDLNSLMIRGRDGSWGIVSEEEQRDNGAASGPVRCYFKNIDAALIGLIQTEPADVFVGCIAWFTDRRLASELQKKGSVSLILDKSSKVSPHLFSELAGLSADICMAIYPDAHPDMFEYSDIGMAPVRYVGFNGSDGRPGPLMHNKFLVFCQLRGGEAVPYAVWTGSANFTTNSRSSFENAVFIRDAVVARAYFDEWAQIAMFSEAYENRAPEPVYGFRVDRTDTVWPEQMRHISYLKEAVYQVDNIVERFLLNLIDDALPEDLYDRKAAEYRPILTEATRLADGLKDDLDSRFVPEAELNSRLGTINGLLKSFSDAEVLADIEECLAEIISDLDEQGV